MNKAVYQLEPLTCPSWIKKIETTLNKIDCIESVKVMFNSNKVKTEFDGSKIKAGKIQETI